jgi:N-acetyl-gamma-glutamyl-phosphate reductase
MTAVVILGASGYSGQETLDRVLAHPELEVAALGSDSLAGKPADTLDPRLQRLDLPDFVTNIEALATRADLVFCCLDHERAAALVPPADTVVLDLTGAHRLGSAVDFAAWYGFDHPHPETLDEWCYALPELAPPTGPLVANPGCHATAVLENVAPYRVGAHQHEPEIAQVLGFDICFVPHLLPVRRGLLATCYVAPTEDDLRDRLDAAYAASPVVTLLPDGAVPDLARVQGTDAAELAIFTHRATGRAIVICALDNLGKGAAGQAMQNANLALGLDETAGLRLAGVLV